MYMNIKENYLLLPKIKDQTVLAKYYSLADVFVICSKRENFPTTCVEAQCCGVPVVGFDTGGTKETSIRSERDFVEYGKICSTEGRNFRRTWPETNGNCFRSKKRIFQRDYGQALHGII